MASVMQTPGARAAALASARPDEVALICVLEDGGEQALTRLQLERWSNRLAHRLAEASVRQGSFVAINLPNCIEHVVATLAAYKLGACPMPMSHKLPASERDAMLGLANPVALFSDAEDANGITRAQMHALDRYSDTPPSDATPQPIKAIASGGSTGAPKLIVSSGAFRCAPDEHPLAQVMGLGDGDRLYSPGPLYHNQAFFFTQIALFVGASAVINERFNADRCLEVIGRHRPTVVSMVPTMMLRTARSPLFGTSDLSGIRSVWHMAAACPEWVKRTWIDRLGADALRELWAATELTGLTTINGSEWMERPGSVGKGFRTEIRILDAERRALPPREVGEIFTRFGGAQPQYQYIGAEPLELIDEGFASVGDLGYLDEDGYLYLADRRTDLIISGGANVYPAEVESALTQLAGVRDAVVIGLKDDDLGRRVHAIVEASDPAAVPTTAELDAHARSLLASYKIPRSYEFIESLPRDEAGKIRRGKLRDARGG